MKKVLIAAAFIAAPLTANAGFMDADWAAKACDAWNANSTLTNELGGDEWAANDGGRGYKTVSSYRTHCGEGSQVQMTIQNKDGKRSVLMVAHQTARRSTHPMTMSCMLPTKTGPAWVRPLSVAAQWAP